MRHLATRAVLVSITLGLIAAGSLGLLIALPYSTSFISSVPPEDAFEPPSPAFRLGALEWPVPSYTESSDLEPFRRLMRTRCADRDGVAAATCVSGLMARSFPNGQPLNDFVDRGFEPIQHMRAHLEGRPGHCMNRSAILAAALLAAGTPARVTQVLSPGLLGHTVVEVWDEGRGWTVVDPTYGLVLHSQGGAANAWALVSGRHSVEWSRAGSAPEGAGDPLALSTWLGGTVVYPEPWLYLRTGKRRAPWPFRGRYTTLRPAHVALGPAQQMLLLVCALASLGAACGLGYALLAARSRVRKSRASA